MSLRGYYAAIISRTSRHGIALAMGMVSKFISVVLAVSVSILAQADQCWDCDVTPGARPIDAMRQVVESDNSEYRLWDSGWRVPVENLDRPHLYGKVKKALAMAYDYAHGIIYDTILEHNPNVAERVSNKVVILSQCFGTDPFVFTAIMREESVFKPGTKVSNGVGLAGMTTNGVNEGNHQFDLCGKGEKNCGSGEGSREYFLSVMQDCVIPKFIELYPETARPLRLIGKARLTRNDMTEPNINLVYSQVVLKTHLGRHAKAPTTDEMYRLALIDYNGNNSRVKLRNKKGKFIGWGPKVKIAYAQSVMADANQLRNKALQTAQMASSK